MRVGADIATSAIRMAGIESTSTGLALRPVIPSENYGLSNLVNIIRFRQIDWIINFY